MTLELDFEKANFARIEAKGPPLGLFSSAEYREYEMILPKEFIMMLVSDGILEILPQKKLSNKLEYLETLIDNFDTSLQTITEKVSLTEKTQNPDDITFLMINRRS